MTTAENKVIGHLLRVMRHRRSLSTAQSYEAVRVPRDKQAAVKQRDVQFSDFEAVASLKKRWGLRKDSLENWHRLWRDNAAVSTAKSPLSMGWVLEAEGKIVGYSGSIPLLYHYGTQPLIAATGHGLVVEPAYRVRSIGLLASFYHQKNIDLFLITTAIPTVGSLSKIFRAKVVPQRDYDMVLFWILNAQRFAMAVIKKFGINGEIGRLVSLVGALALRTEMTMRTRSSEPNLRKSHVTAIEVHEIGADFDGLWQRKLMEKPTLLADRSATSLRWHFTIPGSERKTIVLCCHSHGHLAGYAVVQNVTDEKSGLQRSIMADMLVEEDDPELVQTLLVEAYWRARASGSHVFEVLGFPQNIRQIMKHGKPYFRKYPACPFFYKAKDEILQQILANEYAWYANAFDGDTTLMP